MKLTFVSNYINHHQIPLCEALREQLGGDFIFVQTQRMEQERVRMGWSPQEAEDLPYVVRLYTDSLRAREAISSCDVLLYGWAPEVEGLVEQRLAENKLTFLISERIYKDGQWKAISPRGLLAKYRQYTRYADKPYYLLCAGAYVGSDFSLIHAFPDKKFRWGYFPPVRTYEKGQIWKIKKEAETRGITEMIWAGRFVDFKHAETAVQLAIDLAGRGEKFHLNIVGSGDSEKALQEKIRKAGAEPWVTFTGFQAPDQVRDLMEKSRIMIFTSDHGEGWGAVLNEAMNSACAIVAGTEAGAVPFLLRNGVNGMLYNRMDYKDLFAKTRYLLGDIQLQERFGAAAQRAVMETWNGKTAAARLLRVCDGFLAGKKIRELELPGEGPMSPDPCLKPFLQVPAL